MFFLESRFRLKIHYAHKVLKEDESKYIKLWSWWKLHLTEEQSDLSENDHL